jgi:hypothetical protein
VEALWALPAAFLVIAVLLVVMPLRLALRVATDPFRLDLRLAPFGGLLGEFGLPRRAPRRAPRPEAPDKPHRPRALPARQMLRALPDFLSALAGRIRIDRLRLDLRFGTGDPALTGQLYGWLMALAQGLGRGIVSAAPWLMKALSVAGTAAMFLVGGGILVHGVPALHHAIQHAVQGFGAVAQWLLPTLAEAAVGIVAGALVLLAVTLAKKLRATGRAA